MNWIVSVGQWFAAIPGWHTPAEWEAIGVMGTLGVAVAAAVFAFFQVKELRDNRREQMRPYVAAYLELGREVEVNMMFLVVKNFGETTARNITAKSDKPMKRAWGHQQDPEDLPLFDKLHALVPGQEWRTLFDWGPARFKAELNDAYTLTISSHDSTGKKLPDETFVIDWAVYKPTRNIGVKTVHDVGKSLIKIQDTLARWGEGAHGLKVWTRDGEKKDAEDYADYEQRMAEVEAENAKNQPDPIPSTVVEQIGSWEHDAAIHLPAGEETELPSYPDSSDTDDLAEGDGTPTGT